MFVSKGLCQMLLMIILSSTLATAATTHTQVGEIKATTAASCIHLKTNVVNENLTSLGEQKDVG